MGGGGIRNLQLKFQIKPFICFISIYALKIPYDP